LVLVNRLRGNNYRMNEYGDNHSHRRLGYMYLYIDIYLYILFVSL